MRRPLQGASDALIEMLAQSGELDRILDGRGLTFEESIVIGDPGPADPGLYIPPPDWDAEERERLARARDERIREAAALLESLEPEPEPETEPETEPPTPPKRRGWRKEAA